MKSVVEIVALAEVLTVADVFVTPVVLVVPVVLASAGEGPLPSTDFVIEEIFMELRRRLADEARFQPPRPG